MGLRTFLYLWGYRQPHSERAALPDCALHRDRPAVHADDLLGNCQAQPGAALAAAAPILITRAVAVYAVKALK
jgi:hypothetical protein